MHAHTHTHTACNNNNNNNDKTTTTTTHARSDGGHGGLPLPHLHPDCACPSHICTGTGLTPATSAPGLRCGRYTCGRGVRKDVDKAYEWCSLAVAKGTAEASAYTIVGRC